MTVTSREVVERMLRAGRVRCRLRVPYARVGILGAVYERGRVVARRDGAHEIDLEAELPSSLLGLVAPYRVTGSEESDGGERARDARAPEAGTPMQNLQNAVKSAPAGDFTQI